MLSVLIPVYRYPAFPLVNSLVEQLRNSSFAWEIRVYDDHSPALDQRQNATLTTLDERVVYHELPQNIGRAAIRNLLARDALYEQLIFLDADGEIPTDFIKKYLPFLGEYLVVCGGRYYNENAILSTQQLHWNYGTSRESKTAIQRNRLPYEGFQTNNFMVPKQLMLAHPFDEQMMTYGHEDTLWGWQLAALSIPIQHIDNAVAHLGLETATTFLHKQEIAVASLKLLESKHPGLPSRLGRFANRISWARPVLFPLLQLATSLAKKRLLSSPPASLFWLDMLKLKWYWDKILAILVVFHYF